MPLRTLAFLFIFAVTHLSARDLRVTIALPKGEKIVVQREGKKFLETEIGTMAVTLKPGRRTLIEYIREFRVLDGFEPPLVPAIFSKSKRPPRSRPPVELFRPKSSGWAFEIVASDGPRFVTLQVRAEHRLIDFVTASYGETAMTSQSPDKVVSHATSTDFELVAIPGKPYTIPVRKGRKTIKVTLTCDYVTSRRGAALTFPPPAPTL